MAEPKPADPKPAEATKEELQAADRTFKMIGGGPLSKDSKEWNPLFSKESNPIFFMSSETLDEDLKKIPNLWFSFGLSLKGTEVTDAGLKEIANLKNLTHP